MNAAPRVKREILAAVQIYELIMFDHHVRCLKTGLYCFMTECLHGFLVNL